MTTKTHEGDLLADPTAGASAGLTPRPSEFEGARKAARRGILALLVAQGATPTDIARILACRSELRLSW
jgi:hypothetical protein